MKMKINGDFSLCVLCVAMLIVSPHVFAGILDLLNNDRGSAFAEAVIMGNTEKAKSLIDVHARNPYGFTQLHIAAEYGNKELVTLLLSKGADVNAKTPEGTTPLHSAASYSDKNSGDIAMLLLAHGADANAQTKCGAAPLHGAAFDSGLKMAETLLAHGANVDIQDDEQNTPLNIAARGHQIDAAKLLIAHGANINGKGRSPLSSAALYGDNVEMVRFLVELGANIDTRDAIGGGWTPLATAASRGNTKVVNFLLAHGADPNAQLKGGWTALILAASSDYGKGATEALLNYGARINDTPNTFTALHQAARSGAVQVAEVLIEHKADINALDNLGNTPLNSIIYGSYDDEKRENIAKLLITKGADFNIKGDHGITPLINASCYGKLEVVKLLVASGADVNAASPINCAWVRNHQDVVEFLLAHGAHLSP